MSSLSKSTHDNNVNESGLKHGQFKIQMKTENNQALEYVINPPTQEDYVDGWNLKLPREKKNSTIHHFSVYLSQLPPHLWNLVRIECNEDGSEQYTKIRDKIYHYTVKQTKTDEDVFKLYHLITNQSHDHEEISKLYRSLEQQRVKGWVMLRAKNIITK